MGEIIGCIILSIIAITLFVISYRQFKNKGFLFNNAYIYASKAEREALDKKPHYRQSGIIFLLLGVVLQIIAIDIIIQTGWLFYCELVVLAGTMIYAIVSSVKIDKKAK